MAAWPKVMASAVHSMQGRAALEPKVWIAEAEPKRNPMERIGPQPVQ